MKPCHAVENIVIEDGRLSLDIDGCKHRFSLKEVSETLAAATASEVSRFEISPSGYGIRWPLLDEDISVDGLLGVGHSPVEKSKEA